MADILDQIVRTKRREIAQSQQRWDATALRSRLADAPDVRDFLGPLAREGPIRLIAEVKKASPSRGVLREDFHPVEIAETYARHGASCISVLTDQPYFQGRLEHLEQIRSIVNLPILRKDFILETYQLLEARLAGADAVLLIAECLDDCQLRKLHHETIDLGMTPLVEFYQAENLPRVLDAGARLIGVNSRDLRTFQVDLEHVIRMRRHIPRDCVVVAESGIHSRQDVVHLAEAGIDAILVGEHFMTSDDIGQAVDQLLGRER